MKMSQPGRPMGPYPNEELVRSGGTYQDIRYAIRNSTNADIVGVMFMILVDIINEYGYEDVAFLKRLLAFMKTYVDVFEAIAERHPSDPQEGTKK